MPSLPVKPEFGPTLPELAAPWWRRMPLWLRVLAVVAAVAVLALAASTLRKATSDDVQVIVEEPIGFNLRHPAEFERVDPPPAGELLRLEHHRDDGLFLQSFVVAPLELPPYEGSPGGQYAVVAENLKDHLRERFPEEFRLVGEGRSRINEVPGYEVEFTALHDERRVYGRWIMMVPLSDPPEPLTHGVILQLLGTPAANIPNATRIGDVGGLKLAMRSFRFGTEPP